METIPGPRRAVLRSTVPGLELGVSVQWHDFVLNKQARQRKSPFGAEGVVTLPEYRIPTTFLRLCAKRALVALDRAPCEHCFGPIAHVSLYQVKDYITPGKMRLTQRQKTEGETVYFDASLIPDETQFDERPLQIDDLARLMAEVSALLKTRGDTIHLAPESFGPALRQLNPVRAEFHRDSLVVWMGGKVGYSLTPDSDGGPFINGAWLSGTDYRGVQKIERM